MIDADEKPPRLTIPDDLLTVETVDVALVLYCAAGLRPLLLHAPDENGVCSCGKSHEGSTGKHPIQTKWQSRVLSLDDLRNQVSSLGFVPNVGIVLGKQPNTDDYLIAVDIDDMDRFAELQKEFGDLTDAPRCDSGRGYRLFYTAPPEVDVKQLVNVTGLGGKPGVDVKVESGQVVVAPSLHANGKRYKWTRTGEVPPLPVQWAMQLLKKLEKPKWIDSYTPQMLSKKGHARNRAERYLEVSVTGEARALAACGKGMRNNTLFKSACRCFDLCGGCSLSHKWSWVYDELLRAARASGLQENEIRATLGSAERTIREKGTFRVPMVLADPQSSPSDAPKIAPAPSDDPWMLAPESVRPAIRVTTELYKNVDEAIKALRSDPNLYQREKKLVCVTRVSREQSDASSLVVTDDGEMHRQLVEGTPQICELALPTVRERLSKVAVFQKMKSEELVPIIPTDEIVGAVYTRKGNWPGIRSIIGVMETPIMKPDGTIIQTTGYDPFTHYVYMPSENFPDVKDETATQENARWAFSFLSEIFADFPYVNQAHRSVPLAAILTLVARPAILGSVPAFLFDASTRGSGKTLQTDAIATVSTGRGAPRMNYTTDDVELEKILAGYALKGSSFICLDNVPAMRPFGGGPMDRVITARDEVELRVLGATKVLTLPWRAVVMATGNNMSLYGDTSRRVLMARLEPTEENPEHRTKFTHDNLLGWVKTQRPRLVSAALLLLRAYFRAGRPDMGCARWGSFEEWSRLIPNAIVFAGGEDPMLARPESDEEVDHELRSIKCFLTRIRETNEDVEFRLGSIIDVLYKQRGRDPMTGQVLHDEYEDLRDAIDSIVGRKGIKHDGRMTAPDPVELGRRLAVFKGRVISGLRLVSKVGHGGVMRWRVEAVGTKVSKTSDSETSHEVGPSV